MGKRTETKPVRVPGNHRVALFICTYKIDAHVAPGDFPECHVRRRWRGAPLRQPAPVVVSTGEQVSSPKSRATSQLRTLCRE
jgi:hypothetical protein